MNKEELSAQRAEKWREELRKSRKAKERTDIPRVRMKELDPAYRITNREEVNCGLTREQAVLEATRCLDCVEPLCMTGCPVGINIPKFIKNIERGDFLSAARTLKETSALPAVCGRVCPQERQCESKCFYTQKLKKEPIAIGYLERFAADYEHASGEVALPAMKPCNGVKIAVVGSGPCGLSFAGDMAKWGYRVTVFEALHEIGGVLKYGIPEFRLPNEVVDVEIENLRRMGVEFMTDCIVGKTLSYDDLHEMGFKGIMVASGAGLPRFMNIPGENLNGVMSSNEYLTRVNLMDAANPDSDTPVWRGRRVPARKEEIHHAKQEGVEFLTLHNPVEYIGDERGRVCQMRLQKMELGEPDASGRRSPVPIPGAIETIDIDEVIVSVGVSPNPLVPNSIEGLEVTPKGTIVVNADTLQSSIPDIYAGGDIVRGGATVILAMGDGRRAAVAMHKALQEK